MTTTKKAIILGLATEAVAVAFIVIDGHIGVAAAHDAASLQQAPLAFYLLAQWSHWPAVIVLGVLDVLLETVFGLLGGKPVFFLGFGTGHPAWLLICTIQALLWIGTWALILFPGHSIRHAFSRIHQVA
jgi:hypothetical protein